MSVLENRLRRHRRACEERQRYLAQLELLGERLRADLGRLVAESGSAQADGGSRAGPLLERQGRLERSLAEIEGQVAAAREALAEAEQDLRRHEATSVRRSSRPGIAARRLPQRPARRAP
jgi:chromosome segregation ATPase